MTRFALLAALLLPLASWAKDAAPTEQDPVAEARAVQLSSELRCLVCQNQTIAESNAELAVDLRQQIREQGAAGKSDSEIVDFMVARYGDFVLYRPPFKATTVLLWGGPALLLLLGVAVLVRNLYRRRKRAVDIPITDDERKRAQALLAGKEDPV
jgi:cytochrome c-type biogenesis protein CcmH